MTTRNIKVFRNLKGANAEWADKTRALLKEKNIVMVNMIGSPGCGKTSVLEHIASALQEKLRFAVLEGDLETTRDAERLAAVDVRATQLLTGGGCHLEAKLVYAGLSDLPLDELDFVFVENVGNLVCPVGFDLGEAAKIGFLSVTEGEDKPLKYPFLFRESKATLITKIDLIPHLTFDLNECIANVHTVSPNVTLFQVSSTTGEGMDDWIEWLLNLKR